MKIFPGQRQMFMDYFPTWTAILYRVVWLGHLWWSMWGNNLLNICIDPEKYFIAPEIFSLPIFFLKKFLNYICAPHYLLVCPETLNRCPNIFAAAQISWLPPTDFLVAHKFFYHPPRKLFLVPWNFILVPVKIIVSPRIYLPCPNFLCYHAQIFYVWPF